MKNALVCLWLICGCQSRPKVVAPSSDKELHVVECGRVSAHFEGVQAFDENQQPYPREYGVERLWFELAGTAGPMAFKPKGELFFSDWSFELFSPDCAHLVLLQDHHGPFEVVRTQELAAYLGGAPPRAVLKVAGDAVVHCKARWLSAGRLEYRGCGETELVERYEVPR